MDNLEKFVEDQKIFNHDAVLIAKSGEEVIKSLKKTVSLQGFCIISLAVLTYGLIVRTDKLTAKVEELKKKGE